MNKTKVLFTFSIFASPYAFMDGQFKYLADHGYDITLACGDDPRSKAFTEENHIKFCPIEFPRSLNFIKMIKAFINLYGLIKRNDFDMVIGNMTIDTLLLMILSKMFRIKTRVYYRHGLVHTTKKNLMKWLIIKEEQFVSALATHIVNMSPSVAEIAILDHLNSPSKQYIINKGTCGGIDAIEQFNPQNIKQKKLVELKNKYRLTGDNLVFGYCGRLCKDKGVPELVEGFLLYHDKHPEINAKLLMVGAIDTRDGISWGLFDELNNNQNIVVAGFVDREQIQYYYALMDVLLLPSYREGFGMVTLEASAMEKPVLVSRSHGCIDSIIEHQTGEYIEITPESICTGMELMYDKNIRERLGKEGRKMVLADYDHQVMWPCILNLLNQFINGNN